ncbi:MAG TPA: cytochrome c biogenesis protein CcsA [Gemmatimonadaceae bacterium]|nr:cytochrome c biogenesis protein CcsA [Gemmatimonadaceae bacterium]
MTTAALATKVARPRTRAWTVFGWFAFLFLIASQATAIAISPPDRDMGDLQKIMYVHVPSAWMTMLAPLTVLVFALRYLWKRREQDDLLAASAAEVATTFAGLTLMLGMIWARPTWGVWWTWDARLTSTLVLFLILAGYLALRALVDDRERRAQWSAAVGILGAINVPIVYMSVRWWRTIHQMQSSPATVDPAYVLGLRLNAFAFLFVMVFFIHRRYEAAMIERAAEHAAEAAALGGSST